MAAEVVSNPVQVSLVIPTFNRADLIAATIDSALSQTMPFAEIIIVDDGSTDATTAVIRRYGAQLRVICTENRGVQAARNTGVQAASSAYVTLCDSDDLLQPEYVSVIAPWLGRHDDIDMVYVNFCTFDASAVQADKFSQAPENWFEGATTEGVFLWDIADLYRRTVAYQPLFPTGMMFRRRFYQDLHGYDVGFNRVGGEDWEFTLRAIAAGRIALCRSPLSRIRKHAGNDSGDLVRVLLGEVRILEHALACHDNAGQYACVMRASILARRIDAFHAAFAAGDFVTTGDVLPLLGRTGLGLGFALKKLIASLPGGVRQQVWQMTQKN